MAFVDLSESPPIAPSAAPPLPIGAVQVQMQQVFVRDVADALREGAVKQHDHETNKAEAALRGQKRKEFSQLSEQEKKTRTTENKRNAAAARVKKHMQSNPWCKCKNKMFRIDNSRTGRGYVCAGRHPKHKGPGVSNCWFFLNDSERNGKQQHLWTRAMQLKGKSQSEINKLNMHESIAPRPWATLRPGAQCQQSLMVLAPPEHPIHEGISAVTISHPGEPPPPCAEQRAFPPPSSPSLLSLLPACQT